MPKEVISRELETDEAAGVVLERRQYETRVEWGRQVPESARAVWLVIEHRTNDAGRALYSKAMSEREVDNLIKVLRRAKRQAWADRGI